MAVASPLIGAMVEILDRKKPRPDASRSWASLSEREIEAGFDELTTSALGSLYGHVEQAEHDCRNPYCPSSDLKRLLVVILAFRSKAIAANLHSDLPDKPGMESAHCIGSVIFGDYELDSHGSLILPYGADPLEAGKKWLSRLRKRHNHASPAGAQPTGNALQDWEQTDLFPQLLSLLPGRKGRPRLPR